MLQVIHHTAPNVIRKMGKGIRTHDLCVPKIINIAKILEKQDIYRVEIKKSFPIGTLVQAAPLIPLEPGAV